jgi:two-component system, NarL family, invasion response regulator UvrY
MIRLFVIEDHPIIVFGLRNILRASRDNITIAGTAASISEALEKARDDEFDLFLLDLYLEKGDPERNFHRLKEKFPSKPVIIYTQEASFHWQRRMYNAGVNAYLLKTMDNTLIKSTIQEVFSGKTIYTPMYSQYLTKEPMRLYTDPTYNLTPEQEEYVRLLSEGMTAKDISIKLSEGISSVEKKIMKLRTVFGARNNVDLVRIILTERDD